MATLASSTIARVLPARCLVGRSRSCDLVLPTRDVSATHAMIEWKGTDWWLRDLGSRNGSWLDGRRINADEPTLLLAGARVSFGREAEPWLVQDADQPQLMAVRTSDDRQRVAQSNYLALPDPESPERCVYHDSQGTWVVEHHGNTTAIADREVLVLGDGTAWTVFIPELEPATWPVDSSTLRLSRLRLELSFNRNEEYVEAVVQHGPRTIDLGARAHHYLLLLLARRRLADREAGVAAPEEGWIRQDELAHMLRMTDNHIYIAIHRARTQLGEHDVADAAGLIERRPGTRQLRLGVAQLALVELEPADRGQPKTQGSRQI